MVPPARRAGSTPTHPLHSRGGPGGRRPTGGSIASNQAPAGSPVSAMGDPRRARIAETGEPTRCDRGSPEKASGAGILTTCHISPLTPLLNAPVIMLCGDAGAEFASVVRYGSSGKRHLQHTGRGARATGRRDF